jgi:tRNA-binding EMAP/Myf-like protein
MFKVSEFSKNYVCSVVEITQILPIENADNILRTIIHGNNVIVPKTVSVGDVMLYFCSGTKLNADYCRLNNLYDKSSENASPEKRGFISHKQRRVKAIKLRGVISDGMLMPISSLGPLFPVDVISKLGVGVEFTEINDITVCEKYIAPINPEITQQNKREKATNFDRLIDNQFRFHNDTENLRKHMDKICPDTPISINYKKHGTSAVYANIPVKRKLYWAEKLLLRFGFAIETTEYDVIYSTRRVVKNKYINTRKKNHFYAQDIWGTVYEEIKDLIPRNWTLYGEILGYLPTGSGIQGKYDYGCSPREHKFYVYKISITNSDGKVVYLSDSQISEWCDKVGLNFTDTLIYVGKASELYPDLDTTDTESWRVQFLEQLERDYNEKNCYMCSNKVPEEGIILRVERLESYEAYKLKSKRFILMESDEQEKGMENIEG